MFCWIFTRASQMEDHEFTDDVAYCRCGKRREAELKTMADISIEELGLGVIPEVTKPDGERYRYSIPTWPPGDGGPGYRGHELEIDVFYGGGGGDAEG